MALEEIKIKIGSKEYQAVLNDGKEISFAGQLGKENSFSMKGKSYEIFESFYDERDGITYIQLSDESSKGEKSDGKSTKGRA